MKKIFGLILTFAMLISSIVPTYASASDVVAKKLFLDTAKNTFEQILNESYGEDYLEKYEEVSKKFVENLYETNKFEVTGDNIYSDYYGSKYNVNYKVSYNDDGKSIKLEFGGKMSEEDYEEQFSGIIYVDNEKIFVSFDDVPLVYYFNSDAADEFEEEIGIELDYFKYSNIKKYINILLDLETSDDLDNILKDYQDNFIEYLSKAEFTKNGDEITVVIKPDLVREYIRQLGVKFANDKNIREIYERFELPYEYSDIANEFLSFTEMFASDYDDDTIIKYVGTIENGVFANNELSIMYDEDLYTLKLDFNDVKNGILSDAQFSVNTSFDDESLIFNFSLVDSKDGRIFEFETYTGDTLVVEAKYQYKIDGVNFRTTGEMSLYNEPYFFITEEPEYEILEYNDWLLMQKENGESEIYYLESEINSARVENLRVEELVKNNQEVTVDYVWGMDFLTYIYTSYCEWDDEYYTTIVDEENGIILSPEKYIEALELYISEEELYLEFAKQDLEAFENMNLQEEYERYKSEMEAYYLEQFDEYQEYLDYINNGSPKDIIKTIIDTEQSLTEDLLTMKQLQETYENDELYSSSTMKMSIEKSTEKNVVNVEKAGSLIEYIY